MSSRRSTRRNVVVLDEARAELVEARDFYDREGLGLLFVEAIEREFELLLEFPRIGKSLILGARRLTLIDWPYSIVYQPILGGIYVIAIAHHKRKPGYWRKRLRRR